MKTLARLCTKLRQRKATHWLALLMFVISATPLPVFISQETSAFKGTVANIPGDQPAKEGDEVNEDNTPFPCQGGACGCRTAKHCWTSCCCRTPEQRSAWAKSRNIQPPSYAVLGAPAKKNALTPARKNVANNGNAQKKDSATEPPKKACCQKPAPNTESIGYVILMEAAKCNGMSWDMTSLAVCLPPQFVSMPSCECISEPLVAESRPCTESFTEVPSPPPRSHQALS